MRQAIKAAVATAVVVALNPASAAQASPQATRNVVLWDMGGYQVKASVSVDVSGGVIRSASYFRCLKWTGSAWTGVRCYISMDQRLNVRDPYGTTRTVDRYYRYGWTTYSSASFVGRWQYPVCDAHTAIYPYGYIGGWHWEASATSGWQGPGCA